LRLVIDCLARGGVKVSIQHAYFSTPNLAAILAEERIALAMKNAAALTYGDFGNLA
jgi:hypothetical protein